MLSVTPVVGSTKATAVRPASIQFGIQKSVSVGDRHYLYQAARRTLNHTAASTTRRKTIKKNEAVCMALFSITDGMVN